LPGILPRKREGSESAKPTGKDRISRRTGGSARPMVPSLSRFRSFRVFAARKLNSPARRGPARDVRPICETRDEAVAGERAGERPAERRTVPNGSRGTGCCGDPILGSRSPSGGPMRRRWGDLIPPLVCGVLADLCLVSLAFRPVRAFLLILLIVSVSLVSTALWKLLQWQHQREASRLRPKSVTLSRLAGA
jgi:hypothetical protein